MSEPTRNGETAAVDNITELRQKCPDHGVRWCPECDDPETTWGGSDDGD